MAIRNETRETALLPNAKRLRNALSQAHGLMFRRRITDTGYVFEFSRPQRLGLHMLFVFFPIDCIFLDEDRKAVDLKEGFRPFTFYTSRQKAKYLIEAPAGTIEGKVRLGDRISW
ncbi:DUF192 domain-containing protein [Candidatus Woesearchaeota archaeon]|nr:DUF192 domain-containing protein [Candidatus Woesearchaeota archaeon]